MKPIHVFVDDAHRRQSSFDRRALDEIIIGQDSILRLVATHVS